MGAKRSGALDGVIIRRGDPAGAACPEPAPLVAGVHEPDADGEADGRRDDDGAEDAPHAVPVGSGGVAVRAQRRRVVRSARRGQDGVVAVARGGERGAVPAAVRVVLERRRAVRSAHLRASRARRQAEPRVVQVQPGGHGCGWCGERRWAGGGGGQTPFYEGRSTGG